MVGRPVIQCSRASLGVNGGVTLLLTRNATSVQLEIFSIAPSVSKEKNFGRRGGDSWTNSKYAVPVPLPTKSGASFDTKKVDLHIPYLRSIAHRRHRSALAWINGDIIFCIVHSWTLRHSVLAISHESAAAHDVFAAHGSNLMDIFGPSRCVSSTELCEIAVITFLRKPLTLT